MFWRGTFYRFLTSSLFSSCRLRDKTTWWKEWIDESNFVKQTVISFGVLITAVHTQNLCVRIIECFFFFKSGIWESQWISYKKLSCSITCNTPAAMFFSQHCVLSSLTNDLKLPHTDSRIFCFNIWHPCNVTAAALLQEMRPSTGQTVELHFVNYFVLKGIFLAYPT